MGADLAYIGSPFIATHEAHAIDDYKQAIVDGEAADIIGSTFFTGVYGNYLRRRSSGQVSIRKICLSATSRR